MKVRSHSRTATTTTAALLLMISALLPALAPRRSSLAALAFRATSTAPVGVHRRRRRVPGRHAALSSTSAASPSAPGGRRVTRVYHAPPGAADAGGSAAEILDGDAVGAASSEAARHAPRSRGSRRKQRKEAEEEPGSGALDWESFDFSTSPKTDRRFETAGTSFSDQTGIPEQAMNTISPDSLTYKTYLRAEAELDATTADGTRRSRSDLLSLSPAVVQTSLAALAPFVQPRRIARIDAVLAQRTRHTRFLFENPSNPSNVWACLRTLDSFGVQHVDVVVDSGEYAGKAAVNQKRGMRTAMGSAMWMTLRQFGSLEEAVRCLKEEEGCVIYAADLNPAAQDVRDLTWDVDVVAAAAADDEEGAAADAGDAGAPAQRPVCIVMGNEERGISDAMRELADATFYLPMCGFAESYNLSVATAITLAYMSAASREGAGEAGTRGPLRPGDLDPHEKECLRLKGFVNSIAQKRTAKALLRKEGITLPQSLYEV